MKKLLFLFGALHLLAILVSTQTVEKVEASWRVVRPHYDSFKVESPVDLRYHEQIDFEQSRKYWNRFEDTYFYIFSDPHNDPQQNALTQKFVTSLGQKGQAGEFQGFPSTSFDVTDEEGFRHRILIVKTDKRILSFHAASAEKQNSIADRFFDRIVIGSQASGTPDPNNEPGAGLIKGPYSKGSEIKWPGAGNPAGQDPPPPGEYSPLLILSKPRALYTEFGRFYDINGSVRLRVTFLADGTIGEIAPVTRLPFGLTKSAIQAAKSIRFNPAVLDGKPTMVTKLIEYSFFIY